MVSITLLIDFTNNLFLREYCPPILLLLDMHSDCVVTLACCFWYQIDTSPDYVYMCVATCKSKCIDMIVFKVSTVR